MVKAFLLGLLASALFALTFILNRQISVTGGHWLWTASLRFFWMLPMLTLLLLPSGRIGRVMAHIRAHILPWLAWSTLGFGIFYLFISMAAVSGPAWLTAATWQVTIIAGALMSPLFSLPGTNNKGTGLRTIPVTQILIGLFIGLGVFLLQTGESSRQAASPAPGVPGWIGVVYVLVAAFAYPLGNRKMMVLASRHLGTLERVFGMTLCSMPFWILLCTGGLALGIRPLPSQVFQTFLVALFSGVMATILFFRATEIVKDNLASLAVIESTQAGEVIFSLSGGVLILSDQGPDLWGYLGLAMILAGLLLNPLAVLAKNKS